MLAVYFFVAALDFFVTAQTFAAEVDSFVKLQRTVLPWLKPIGAATGDVDALAAACINASGTPPCNAFTTDGSLYHCPGGRCDCDSGSDACARGRDIFSTNKDTGFGAATTDLFVLRGRSPPPEWADRVQTGAMIYSAPDPPSCYLPEVGNGYLATVPSWGSMHVGGLFNGACGTTSKARFPSPVALSVVGGTVTAGGLDTFAGAYSRRWLLIDGAEFDVRTWAHRTRPHVLVLDVMLAVGSRRADFNVSTLWDPEKQRTDVSGNGCAGSFSVDLAFRPPSGSAPTVWSGETLLPNDEGQRPNVSVALDPLPTSISLTADAPRMRFIVSVAASTDFPNGVGSVGDVAKLAVSEYTAASALSWEALWKEHADAWAALNAARIDVVPASSDPGEIARADDIASHARSSQYFLFSSLRDDHFPGISPGGLSTQNYQGAVFMDADWWIEPPLYFLAPRLAAAILQYRFLSMPVMRQLAVRFGFGGFGGAMAAWTAAYLGNPFGCCSGSGGYEDCLEHHTSGDIAFSAWQYFAATGNETWLRSVGFELLSGIADFHLARVTPTPPTSAQLVGNTSFHVERVLPIDEWSVGSGCGSETPGVNDDAQMNGVVKASLVLAAAAARVLGIVSEHSLLWDAVGRNVVLLYNATHGHHDQFTSPACPDGWGGSHYTTEHTVCPTDVEHLTYPLGDVLNISAADSRADAELYFGITCRENAGMTTPMHTIVWLALGEPTLAAAEFNRSMHAAAYGPFNVRNEVDKHVDVPGGHFDNTHFLTGDGGFLQALINGYGGLRITLEGLRLLRPTLPESVGTLSLRGIAWRGCTCTITVTSEDEVLSIHNCAVAREHMCVIDANGGRENVIVGGTETSLSRASFAYPGLLVDRTCSAL